MRTPTPSNLDARGMRIAVVVSRYHDDVTAALRDGAACRFADSGGDAGDLILVAAAGAFELTAICTGLAERPHPDAIVALGCVISGETTHDRYICEAVANGLTGITVRTGVPIAFGLLTCQTLDQARERAGGTRGNKGDEAMAAAIETVATLRQLRAARVPDEATL